MEILDNPDIRKIERDGYLDDYDYNVYCDYCEEGIADGEVYYKINGENYCEMCLTDLFSELA